MAKMKGAWGNALKQRAAKAEAMQKKAEDLRAKKVKAAKLEVGPEGSPESMGKALGKTLGKALKKSVKVLHDQAQVARDKALGKSPLTGEPMKMVTAPAVGLSQPDKGWPNKEDAQGFLFGEADKIRTALSSELVIINAEIDSAEKSQVSIENRIDSLEARRRVVEDAMKSLDKVKDEKFPIAKKKEKKA
jgi:hypothetical protein